MADPVRVLPEDIHNLELVGNVHPRSWVNPEPAKRYTLVVIGAGPAGLVAAAGAAGLGAKVALVERELMGGDCLNVGCVPSKALLRAARAWAAVRDAGEFGIEVPAGTRVHFPMVMERMRRLRAAMSGNDSAERFSKLGVDVFLGEGRFSGPDTVEVAGKSLRFRKAVIATGARATRPDIPGLAETGYFTNETIFTLTELPARLAVIGAGPLGCELTQAFARFGSEVTLLANHGQILPREDSDAVRIVEAALKRDGVRIWPGTQVVGVMSRGGEKILSLKRDAKSEELAVDAILVAVGRTPNVEALDLHKAGVQYDLATGIQVSDRLQTTNSRVFAAGDCCSHYKFTHAADAMARLVIRNALFLGRGKVSALTIPHCTYTDPEIAHVGLRDHEAREQGIDVQTFTEPLAHVDRAILDGETDGFVKIHVRAGSDCIVGATIVAKHAGDLIGEIVLAMEGKIGLGRIANVIHPYPTQAEAIRKLGDAFNRTRLTGMVKWVLAWWLR
ncbi:MAG TPA: mercuric reductase [Gemmataceae bacterium]|nr:mercuric reductase [Gemmataceae bacterium]